MEDYTKHVLRVVAAQICQTIGWHTIQSTPLELLTDILHKFLQEITRQTSRYTELYGRTEANLDDIALAFRDLNVNISDLVEYINNVDAVPCAVDVPQYPARKQTNLSFLKPGSKEVIARPVHIHEHLPPICPEKEEISTPIYTTTPSFSSDTQSSAMADITNVATNNFTISGDNPIFKHPDFADLHSLKKPRSHEDEGRPTREISSVMMTSSGFISPAREGKLPDAKTPILPEPKMTQSVVTSPPLGGTAISSTAPNTITTTAIPITAIESKFEKKSKKQKSMAAANSVEVKEQRKREKQLARLQKFRTVVLAGGNGNELPSKISGDLGKRRKRKTKIKNSTSNGDRTTKVSHHISSTNLDVLTPVSLPPDLTIKSETIPISSAYTNITAISTIPSLIDSISGELDVKPALTHEIKLSSEPDKQKYSIFKKISKKSREDHHHGYNHSKSLNSNNAGHNLYSGLPPLPESTTIRPIQAIKPEIDSNVIVVDDDTPPPPSSSSSSLATPQLSASIMPVAGTTQTLPIPKLPAGTTATMHPRNLHPQSSSLFDQFVTDPKFNVDITSTPPRKLQRKPRKMKQLQQKLEIMIEQTTPLNLSNVTSTLAPTSTRKVKAKVGRPSKRSMENVTLLVPQNRQENLQNVNAMASGMLSSPSPTVTNSTNIRFNMFKDNPIMGGMQRYPLLYPFPLLPGPGLIPSTNFMHPIANPLTHFGNPFSSVRLSSDFIGGLRPPTRPQKLDETSIATTPPPTLPLDLDSNVYCNVPSLVPDSLKYQLSPSLMSKGKQSINSPSSSNLAFGSLPTGTSSNSANISGNRILQQFKATRSPNINDTPIEISDDEKIKSDNETDSSVKLRRNSLDGGTISDKSPGKNSSSLALSSNQRAGSDDRMIIDEECGVDSTANVDERTISNRQSIITPDESVLGLGAKSDKKRDKEHKKGKRGKDGKIKKKKDKKDKSKSKDRAEKRKEEKKDRQKKQKKEKRKDKLRATSYNSDEIKSTDPSFHDHLSSSVPKLTVIFGSPRSATSSDSPEDRKSVDDVCGDDIIGGGSNIDVRRESSPELARISPLVTRPPKQKIPAKEKNSDTEQLSIGNLPSSASVATTAIPFVSTARGPRRPSKGQFKSSQAPAIPVLPSHNFLGNSDLSENLSTTISNVHGTERSFNVSNYPLAAGKKPSGSTSSSSSPAGRKSHSEVATTGGGSGGGGGNLIGKKQVASEIDSTDAEGNQVWICPACGRVDDGTPMIGCDGCDAWYHWVCVGIQVPPDEREDWYCRVCIAKKQEGNGTDKKKKRKKKNKTN